MKDAFSVVNNNGKAFRDARITPEYLAVRLEELKWGVVAHELKLQEREEQRRIKERIREDVFKVGLTRRLEPLDRIKELGDASVPFDFDVHALIHSDDAPALERELHKRFVRAQVNKVNPRKEFFRVALQQIRSEVEGMGLQAQWTMAAECREYKETQAIERSMQNPSFEEGAWIKQQLKAHDAALSEVVREEEAA